MNKQNIPAQLLLEDGTVLSGFSFGSPLNSDGEVVFNTGMVGYPESLTDPSYRGQILTYTYPLIGNYGVPAGPWESDHIQVRGVIVSQYESAYSHWQAKQNLGAWLCQEGIPGITGIDTRALTKKLRTHGVMLGRIEIGSKKTARPISRAISHPTQRRKLLNAIKDPNRTNLVAEVSIKKPRWYGSKTARKKIILIDCGVKQAIIDNFTQRGISVLRVPWNYDFRSHFRPHFESFKNRSAKKMPTVIQCDGLFISNGPGDPKMCPQTIAHVHDMLKTNVPQFGICLGSQIQGLAAGAKTYKLKYGHRGQNQPCIVRDSQQCILTSQNHGYAVREHTLPKNWKILYRNANDNSVEGLIHTSKPFFSTQFHPESTPGPNDANALFDTFISTL